MTPTSLKRSAKTLAVLVALCSLASASTAFADRKEPPPKALEGVELKVLLEAQIPLDTQFTNEAGQQITLGSLFDKGKAVILTFNYSNCPLLCSVQLGGLVDTMEFMEADLGTTYEVITIGLDPKETLSRAAETKKRYLDRYNRLGTSSSWHFLKGDAESVKAVADSVGFHFRFFPKRKEYLHPSVLVIMSPKGTVSGYLPGVKFEHVVLTNRVDRAIKGEISTEVSDFIFSCFHYEPTANGAMGFKIMQYGGLAFIIGIGAVFGIMRHRNSSSRSTGNHV